MTNFYPNTVEDVSILTKHFQHNPEDLSKHALEVYPYLSQILQQDQCNVTEGLLRLFHAKAPAREMCLCIGHVWEKINTVETVDSTVETDNTDNTVDSTVETVDSTVETVDSTVETDNTDNTVETVDSTVETVDNNTDSHPTTNPKILFWIKETATVLDRIKGKKYPFYAQFFPLILRKTFCNFDYLAQDNVPQAKSVSDDVFGEFCSDLCWFIHRLKTIGKCHCEIMGNTDDKLERDWIFYFCFELIAKISSSDNLSKRFSKELVDLIDLIHQSHPSIRYIVDYSRRHSQWKENKHESELANVDDEFFESDSDDDSTQELELFVQWNKIGIGCFLCNLKDYFRVQYYLPKVWMSFVIPYIHSMLESTIPTIATKANYWIRDFLKCISISSDTVNESELPQVFPFINGMLNFVSSCPVNDIRNLAFHNFKDYLSKFDSKSRFLLLKKSIVECPFPILRGLLVQKLKEEIHAEYNSILQYCRQITKESGMTRKSENMKESIVHPIQSEKTVSTNHLSTPFIQVSESVTCSLRKRTFHFATRDTIDTLFNILVPNAIDDHSDDTHGFILHVLNLYYFLWLRDFHANVSGIRETKMSWSKEVFTPLLQQIEDRLDYIRSQNVPLVWDSDESDFDFTEQELEDLGMTQEEVDLLVEEQKGKKNQQLYGDIPPEHHVKFEMNALMLKDLITRIQNAFQLSESFQ